MKFHFFKSTLLGLSLLLLSIPAQADETELKTLLSNFGEQKICVGFSVEKTMFMLSTSQIIGTQCALETSVQKGSSIQLTIKTTAFKSGDEKRDDHLGEILGGETEQAMVFTATLSDQTPKSIVETGKLSGQLNVMGKDYPVELTVIRIEDEGFKGYGFSYKTTMSSLGVEPPRAVGGMMFKVADEMTLFGRISDESLNP